MHQEGVNKNSSDPPEESSSACLKRILIENGARFRIQNKYLQKEKRIDVKSPEFKESPSGKLMELLESSCKGYERILKEIESQEDQLMTSLGSEETPAKRIRRLLNEHSKRPEAKRQQNQQEEDPNSFKDSTKEDCSEEDFLEEDPEEMDSPSQRLRRYLADHRTNKSRQQDSHHSEPSDDSAELTVVECIGRSKEKRDVIRILSRKQQNCLVIVGEQGVGKTKLINWMIANWEQFDTPHDLRSKSFQHLDLSGFTYPMGDGELKSTIASALKRSTILVIENIHLMTMSRGSAFGDLSAHFRTALSQGLQCIGVTEPGSYSGSIGRDPSLARYFQVLTLAEMGEEETFSILQGLVAEYEEHYEVSISDDVLREVIALSVKALPDRYLPSKAIELLDKAFSYGRLPLAEDGECPRGVCSADIVAAIGDLGGGVGGEDSDLLLNLESYLERRVIGQPEAVSTVANGIRCFRSGLTTSNRILGFIFAGGTGLGKTLMAKTMARALNCKLLRFDMSEFKHPTDIVRLIGAPPSYKESELGGMLTNGIRAFPRSVVLFDEIEKANPQCLDILLHLLDEGYVMDGMGQKAVFRQAIVVLTTNLGGRVVQSANRSVEFMTGEEEQSGELSFYQQQILAALREHLRPELLNRIQKTVYFKPLDQEAIHRVIDLVLEQTSIRLQDKGIQLQLGKGAYELLGREGYHPEYGARAVERAVERLLIEPLAMQLLRGDVPRGSSVWVDGQSSALAFRVMPTFLERGHSEAG